MKKIALSLILCLLSEMSIYAAGFAVRNSDGVKIYYVSRVHDRSDEDNEVTVINSPSGYSGVLVIPGTVVYGGVTYSVTRIDDIGSRNLTKIIIPNTVTWIEEISDCGLTEITIPNSVKSMDGFSNCPNLTKVVIEDGEEPLKSWNRYRGNGYSGKINNITSVYLGRNIVGDSPFYEQTRLTKATIGESVTSIAEYLFYGCTGLKEVTIPNSVEEIGKGAFGHTGLMKLIIPQSVTSIGVGAFANCPLHEVIIPNSVKEIGEYAFSDTGLKEITIPNSVTEIKSGTFENCKNLTSLTIGNSITSIGDEAFSGCSSLTKLDIPNSVESIGKKAFKDCRSLTGTLNISNSVSFVGDNAFDGCTKLKLTIWGVQIQ